MKKSKGIPSQSSGGRLWLWCISAMILAAVIVAYSNHFHNGFHFDDSHTIENNVFIRDIRNIPLFFRDGATFSSLPTNQSYRPLVTTTLALDYYAGKGLDPFYFHLSTFLIFLLQGVLMYFLYLRVFDLAYKHKWNPFIALAGVALYLLHPANAETINYIIARSDSLSTFFIILAFVLFLYSPFSRRWHLYLIPVALGALAKPIAAVFAPLLAAFLLLFPEGFSSPGDKSRSRALIKALPSVVFCLFLLIFLKKMDPPTWIPGGSSLSGYVITQPYVILRYFMSFLLPVSLSADTDLRPFATIDDIRFAGGLLFVILLVTAGVLARRWDRTRPAAFGIFWFLISLIPTSLIPLAEVANDHRIFLPFVGLTLSACWSVALLLERIGASFNTGDSSKRRLLFGGVSAFLIVMVLTAYAFGTYQRNKVWRSEETLWKDVTEKSPLNGRGLMNYGLSLMAKADFSGAESYFMRAYELIPGYPYLNINLGILNAALGKPEEAERFFRRAITYGPGYPECYYRYAHFLWKQGQSAEAEKNLRKAIELAPAHLQARYLLMEIYSEKAETSKLAEVVDEALRISPGDQRSRSYLALLKSAKGTNTEARGTYAETPEALLISSVGYYRKGDYPRSIGAARAALRLRPDYDLAYNNICAAYNAMGEWDKAIAACEKAVKLNTGNQIARNNLAWARNHKLNAAGPGEK